MRRPLYLLPLVLFLLLTLYFSVSLRPGYDPHTLPSAMIDRPAPGFSLADMNGQAVTLAAIAGKPVIVNFFASWCVPCRIEHPILMRLARENDIMMVGIAYKDKQENAARLLTQSGNPYRRVGLDLDGQTGLDFGVYGVPETYILDKNGRIRKRFVGPLTEDIVATELLPLLKSLNES